MGGKRKKQPQRESVVDKGEICESLGEAVQVESLSVCESNETIGKKVTVQDLLVFCPAKKVTPFRDLIRERKWKDITKIGEATFSEVFHALDHSNNKQTEPVAIKVIPFGRPEIVINDSAQLTVETVYKEILITSILNELSVNSGMKGGGLNFVKLKSVAICSGPYPKELLNSWDTWDSENESENDRPDILPSDQLYAVLILEDGGNDLEHVLLNTWKQVRSLFAQIAVSLAVAEKKLNFEHRDLHWGNVLVAPTKVQVLSYQMGERLVKVQTGGIRVSLIDFTLSRLEKDGQVHSFPFDNSFFEGEGELHFDVYRIMRKILNDEWHRFEPVTNFQWLHYLTRQVVVGKCVPQSTSQEARRQKEKLKAFGNRLMGVVISRGDRGSGSGMESVLTDEYLSSIVEVVAD
ncbi:Serine/threonine-protein kinase haspin [Quaeritorhiza haematococci]|nr:Serine/threonine-protein kinase haspin [Quaeritorhiza haematococci]